MVPIRHREEEMRILVLKHVDCEGLGVWEEFCRGEGIAVDVAQLHRGDPLPPPGRYHGVVSLGGPMNVYQEEIYPFLKMEDQFIREALAGGVPFLGICLGGQLLAKAVGGIVMLNAAKEIGWHRVTLNEMGVRDPLFAGLPESFTVFQWHSDTFRPPVQAVPLASSPLCQHQAFRLRGFAYALQFHLEVTAPMIGEWARAYELAEPRILAEAPAQCERLRPLSRQVFENFLRLLRLTGAARDRRAAERV